MADNITKKFLDTEGLKTFWGQVKDKIKTDITAAKNEMSNTYVTTTNAENTYAKKTDLNAYVTTGHLATNYYDKEHIELYYLGKEHIMNNYATKEYVSSALTGALDYKGSKPSYDDLPTTGNEKGDMWHVSGESVNYVWNGESWDEMGGSVDLSNYYDKDQVDDKFVDYYTKLDIDNAVNTINAKFSDYYTMTQIEGKLDGYVPKLISSGPLDTDSKTSINSSLDGVTISNKNRTAQGTAGNPRKESSIAVSYENGAIINTSSEKQETIVTGSGATTVGTTVNTTKYTTVESKDDKLTLKAYAKAIDKENGSNEVYNNSSSITLTSNSIQVESLGGLQRKIGDSVYDYLDGSMAISETEIKNDICK